MRIQHNILAMNAYRNYNTNTSAVAKNLEKLSSGYKINRAGDDAAGLAISEKMRAQITGLNAAQKNVKDGISLVKTGEGAMQEIHDMLNRMTYLATQSANGTYDNEVDRANLQKEVESLKSEINRIADSANFNGIKLLDGSMDDRATDELTDASAVSALTTQEFASAGKAAAFEATYKTNRPEAATQQTSASFTVQFDDASVAAIATGKNAVVVSIGGKDIELTFDDETAKTGADIAAQLAQSGVAIKGGADLMEVVANATPTTADIDKMKTEAWNNAANTEVSTTAADNKYINIGDHWWKMTAGTGATANQVTFTQVDYMGETGEVVTPDYEVKVSQKTGGGAVSGTTNWQVQNPTIGTGVGSSHQAQVEVAIDFSKLKDGDVLTAGDYNYHFKLDANDTTTADANGLKVIDLTDIFKTESDLTNADKQAQAMAKIAKEMGTVAKDPAAAAGTDAADKNDTWSVGNGGVKDGIGTLTFQSLSSYNGDTVDANKAYIGGDSNNGVCDMRTEASVMKQFYAESVATSAAASFELDVTKLKDGDTITIDGTTFEFCDGTVPSDKANVVVDLSAAGIAGGLRSSQTGEVLDALKTAINNTLNYGYVKNSTTLDTKYDISVDGNKMTLTSKDNSSTNGIKEDRIAAKIELPDSAYKSGSALTLQIGDTADSFNQLKVSIGDMHTKALGIDGISIANQKDAAAAIDVVKNAINYVSGVRGDLGATQNRLEHTANNLSVMAENIQDAESTIRDTDIAEEMMAYTKNNILVQSAQAMLAQANQIPQGVLQLLG